MGLKFFGHPYGMILKALKMVKSLPVMITTNHVLCIEYVKVDIAISNRLLPQLELQVTMIMVPIRSCSNAITLHLSLIVMTTHLLHLLL